MNNRKKELLVIAVFFICLVRGTLLDFDLAAAGESDESDGLVWTFLDVPRFGLKIDVPSGKGGRIDYWTIGHDPLAIDVDTPMKRAHEMMKSKPATVSDWNWYVAVVPVPAKPYPGTLVVSLFVHEKQPVSYERAVEGVKGMARMMLMPEDIKVLKVTGTPKFEVNGLEGYELKPDHPNLPVRRLLVFFKGGRQFVLQFQYEIEQEALFLETMARIVGSWRIS